MENTFAARLGGWSVRHRKTAVLGWLVFVLAAAFGTAVGQRQMTMHEYAAGDSALAVRILDEAGIRPQAGEMVLIHSGTMTAEAADFKAAVTELIAPVQATGDVVDIREPYQTGLISSDRHSALVQFTMTGDAESSFERVQPVLDAVARVRSAYPTVSIEQFGVASANKWLNDTVIRDFRRAE